MGEGLASENRPPPRLSSFIAGRPKAALLFWFFGDFRCSVSLLIDIFLL